MFNFILPQFWWQRAPPQQWLRPSRKPTSLAQQNCSEPWPPFLRRWSWRESWSWWPESGPSRRRKQWWWRGWKSRWRTPTFRSSPQSPPGACWDPCHGDLLSQVVQSYQNLLCHSAGKVISSVGVIPPDVLFEKDEIRPQSILLYISNTCFKTAARNWQRMLKT